MPTRTSRRAAAAVAGGTLLWLLATAWMRPLMLPDEGRYAGVAWEMLRSGEWLTPTLNGLPYFHKPPLFYWITAASMSVFGVHPWAARAAPLLGAVLGAVSVFAFVRRWASPRMARLALVALLVQPMFYLGGQFANLDMLVAGCITATIVLWAHAALSAGQGLPMQGALRLGYATAALGVLAKGLIGALLPALVIVGWLALRARWRELRALWSWSGLVIFALLAGPWFVLMQRRFDGFLDYFFVVQHFKRFAAGGFNNVQPFWFYPAILLLATLPWWPWLRRLAVKGYLHDPALGALRQLMLLWLLVIVAFFSLPASKLLGYVLPALAPLAFLVADGVSGVSVPTPRSQRMWWAACGLAGVLSVGAVIGLAVRPTRSSKPIAQALLAQRVADEPVYMLGDYYFDLPFYARLRTPVVVVDAWDSASVNARDNWRKELADAGRFAPAAARATLIELPALAPALCATRGAWLIGSVRASEQHAVLRSMQPVAAAGDVRLWRIDASTAAAEAALDCAKPLDAEFADN